MRTKREQIKSKVTHYRTVLQKYKRLFPTCADRMWAIRKSMDMNQAEFGEHVGLTSSCICSIECGYHLPRGITLTKIISATGLSGDFLLAVEDKVDGRALKKTERYLEQAESEMAGGSGRKRQLAPQAGG